MVELVYTQDLKSCLFGDVGSTPTLGTLKNFKALRRAVFFIIFTCSGGVEENEVCFGAPARKPRAAGLRVEIF